MSLEPEEKFDVFDSTRWNVFGNVATNIGNKTGTAFGETAIDSGRHEWLVKYENTKKQDDSGIGISSTTETLTSWFPDKPNSIGLYIRSNRICSRINYSSRQDKTINNIGAKNGDLFRIQLDYDNKTVKFYQNDTLLLTETNLSTGDGIKYRLVVSVSGSQGDKFTILESRGSPKISLKPLSLQLALMEQSIKIFQPKLGKLTFGQLTELQKKNKAFFDECKEFEQNYETLQQTVKKFDVAIKQKLNPNTKNYKKWNADTICRYILSLEDGRYAKYVDALKTAIEKQEIDGEDLATITANDLYTMGVTKLKDRKALQFHLNGLASKHIEGDKKTDYH
eukprot:525872_1